MLALYVDRAVTLLQQGQPLPAMLPRDLRVPVAGFIGGGLAIAQAIRQADFDVWTQRPRVSRMRKLRILLAAWARQQFSSALPAK